MKKFATFFYQIMIKNYFFINFIIKKLIMVKIIIVTIFKNKK